VVVVRVEEIDNGSNCAGNEGREGKIAVYRCGGMELSLGGGFPLKQTFAGDESPNQCANDGVKAEQSLMRKKDEIQERNESRLPETDDSFTRGAFAAIDECAAEAE
jgi:hypothetical protein